MTTYFFGRGVTSKCLNALLYALSTDIIHKVTDYAWDRGGHFAHCFRLEGEKDSYVIPDGFSSGYSGEGPRGYEEAYEWFRLLSVPVTRIQVHVNEAEDILYKCSRYEAVSGNYGNRSYRKLNLGEDTRGRVHGNWKGLRRSREQGLQSVLDVQAYKDRVDPWTRGRMLRDRRIV
jgi:hypothetical protein